MNVAYWCILVVAVLPYAWHSMSRASAGPIDNHDPRRGMAQIGEGLARRANNAQYNAFEAFAPFAAAVLMAQAAGVDVTRISQLAVAFVVLRVLHGVCYLTDMAALRSLVWAAGFACVMALMVLAAMAIA